MVPLSITLILTGFTYGEVQVIGYIRRGLPLNFRMELVLLHLKMKVAVQLFRPGTAITVHFRR